MGINNTKDENNNCCISEEQEDELQYHKSNCCLSNFYLCLFVTETCVCKCLEKVDSDI